MRGVALFTCVLLGCAAGNAAQEITGLVFPRVIKEVTPPYPPEVKEEKIEGQVWLECVVNVGGEPTDIAVAKGLHETLDTAAIDALKQWRFKPATKDGEPIAMKITVEFRFKPSD
jgi:periplasmic protein TonB